MNPFFDGDHHIGGKGAEHIFVRHRVGGRVPIGKGLDGARDGVADNLVFHRPEQHLSDGDDKGDQDEQQQRRDQQ